MSSAYTLSQKEREIEDIKKKQFFKFSSFLGERDTSVLIRFSEGGLIYLCVCLSSFLSSPSCWNPILSKGHRQIIYSFFCFCPILSGCGLWVRFHLSTQTERRIKNMKLLPSFCCKLHCTFVQFKRSYTVPV